MDAIGSGAADKVVAAEEYRRLRRLGKKYCMEHPPVRKQEVWELCMAGLRDLSSGFAAALSEIGHDRVRVQATEPEDIKYFENILAMYDQKPEDRDGDAFAVQAERVFLMLDVCKFSLFAVQIQPVVLSELQDCTDQVLSPSDHPTLERKIHTGDGFVLAFHTAHIPEPWPIQLAQALARALRERNQRKGPINFRISISRGMVFLTRDLDGATNYIGPGIIEARRVLDGIPKDRMDVIYFDEGVYKAYLSRLSDLKVRQEDPIRDKHGLVHPMFRLEYV
jgi:class 3 adenylate cyclase